MAIDLPTGLARPNLYRTQAFVGGIWCDARSGGTIAVDNPATGDIIATVPKLAAAEIGNAIAIAQERMPDWASQPARYRARILRRWFDLIIEHRDDLARILTAEHGKTQNEARAEAEYAAAFVEWFAEEASRSYGDITPSPLADRRILTLKQPVGVCAAITPWNFPLAMLTRKIAPALAAGCAMILKPASQTPLSALALAVLAEEAGVPPGILSVVTGSAGEIGGVLTSSPIIRKLSFTGSTEVGAMLAEQCAPTIKRLSLELGGNAPLIVFDDADLNTAVEGAFAAKFRNGGQSCVAANRIYVQSGIYTAFVEEFARRVGMMRLGDGMAVDVDIGPLIDEAAVAKAREHVADALARGAVQVVGGNGDGLGPRFFRPTVLSDVPADALAAREETFGPVAPIIKFENESEVLELANDSPFGLAAYLFSRDLGQVWRVSEALEAGMVGVNTGLISTAVAPFGGIKMSGLGREGSRYGLDEYQEIKYVAHAGL
jgi:succinate-semialdehyde dehydrogenase / glutarate-semialdehyde dehydrogenase